MPETTKKPPQSDPFADMPDPFAEMQEGGTPQIPIPSEARPLPRPKVDMTTGEGPIARNLTSFEAQLSQMPQAFVRQLMAKHWPIVDARNYTELWNDIKLLNPVMREYEGGGVDWGATAANLLPMLVDVGGRGVGESPAVAAVKAGGAGLGKATSRLLDIKPEAVPIAGEEIPLLKGEAHPGTLGGRVQRWVKRSGLGGQDFRDFAVKQQAAVKQAIRNVGQQSAGLIGPMADEPAEAMHDAADATFAKARPMYQEMDRALVTIPDSMGTVSKVVEQAIARAEKLGAKISRGEPEEVWVSGQRYTPQNNPRAWQLLKQQGMIPAQAGQSLESYMKVRSELQKMKRGATDASQRYAINNEIHSMNANMETALRGTPLHDNWIQAERLWSKGYAIRDVAEALRESTEGTPASVQAKGLSKVPTTMRGSSLVGRLNDLEHEGVLTKAFSREEAVNLRQAADILDRASAAPGREFGIGYTPRNTIRRFLLHVPAYPLVKAMTSTEGLEALRAFDKANTPSQMGAAINRFARIAGVAIPAASISEGRRDRESKPKKQQQKSPGQQISDLRAIQEKFSDNPAMPIGTG